MNLNLSGKRALVCGASQGIGRAVALELAAMGAGVTLFGRNADGLEEVRHELAVKSGQAHHVLVADFSRPEEVRLAIEKHLVSTGSLNILINNTGGPAPGPAHLADSSAFLAAFNQHLICNQLLVQALLPGMKAANYGRVINIISTSVKQPIPNLGVSNTIRGAVASWAKTLAGELGRFGITVNNVLPGSTNTARLGAIIDNKAAKGGKSREEVVADEKAVIPLGRFADANEIAYAVAFLASPAAAYITGINLPVDGGRTSCL
ncbi:MAG TPA: SDR family oxidoreductase [Gemmatales bacterium]|nr:SDR family oxidoreductase [Gemmatales bacterium]